MKTKTTEAIALKEWRLISEIGWDAPKLKALLPKLKNDRNIEEVKSMIKRCSGSQQTERKAKKASTTTAIAYDGLIKIVDNGSNVDYQIGQFSYLCEDNTVIVTNGTVNINFYTYLSDEEALNAGFKMAKRQETVEKEVLNQQRRSVKSSAKTQRSTQRITVK